MVYGMRQEANDVQVDAGEREGVRKSQHNLDS